MDGHIEPIVPVRGLIDLGYKLQWSRSGCVVVHPKRGKISSWLRDGCPVVAEEDALALIADIENAERKKVEDLNQEEESGWGHHDVVAEAFPASPKPSVSLHVGSSRQLIKSIAVEQKCEKTTATVKKDPTSPLCRGEGGGMEGFGGSWLGT